MTIAMPKVNLIIVIPLLLIVVFFVIKGLMR